MNPDLWVLEGTWQATGDMQRYEWLCLADGTILHRVFRLAGATWELMGASRTSAFTARQTWNKLWHVRGFRQPDRSNEPNAACDPSAPPPFLHRTGLRSSPV